MLSARGLNAGYGKAQVLFDVSLDVAAGEVAVLLGRNGAGKSTTLETIMGLVEARSGEVRFAAHDITHESPHTIARLGVGFVPEDRRIFTDLTVEENLQVGKQPARADAPTWTHERLFALFPNLAEMRARRGAEMSGGEQQMLAIARTLMGNPRCVLLDEPSEGLAPVIVEQMAHAIIELKAAGLAVLLSEQNLRFAAAVADRAHILESGHVRYSGSMAELAADAAIREAYLSV